MNETATDKNRATVGGSSIQRLVMRISRLVGGNDILASIIVIAAQWLIAALFLAAILGLLGAERFIAVFAILKMMEFLGDMLKISKNVWNA